jgi:hypothetical protein
MSAGDLFRAGAVAIGLLAVATVVRMAGSLLDEELRSRIFRLPHLLLRLARRRLPADLRQLYDQEWLPDLEFIVRATEGLPVTRLVRGTSHALGILVSARRIVQAHDPHGRYAIVRDLAGARDRALSLARGVSVLYARERSVDPASARAFATELDLTIGLAAGLKDADDLVACAAIADDLTRVIGDHLARARTSALARDILIARPPSTASSGRGTDLDLVHRLERAHHRAEAIIARASATSAET